MCHARSRLIKASTLDDREEMLRARVKAAHEAIAIGMKLYDFAMELGVKPGGLQRYFERNGYKSIVEGFKNNPKGNTIHGEQLVERLRVIAEEEAKGRGYLTRASKRLGISYQRVDQWLRAVAPDGARNALTDYEDDGMSYTSI